MITMLFLTLTTSFFMSYKPTILLWSLILISLITLFPPSCTTPINSWLFIDMLSFVMISLSMITLLLISISSNYFNKMILTISPITIILVFTFSTNNMILFYILFELVLIPTFILITSLGKQPERLQASIYLLLYTVLASLPLLVGIISISPNANFILPMTLNFQLPLALIFITAFLVKLPMFFTHLWLPKAHVEAPLEGSMVLAAILLKLGGYGLLRFSMILTKAFNAISPWLISLSLIGATFTGLNCLRQKDMKALIAYSSVAHMALVIVSISSMKTSSPSSAIAMMLAHGLTSSALFFMVNILYLQHHTRNILAFKGLLNNHPNLTFWLFIFLALNLSAPPSLNFLSETTIIISSSTWSPSTMLPLFTTTLATASFCFIMYIMISHSNNLLFNPSSPPSQKTFISLFSHAAPLLIIMAKPEICMI